MAFAQAGRATRWDLPRFLLITYIIGNMVHNFYPHGASNARVLAVIASLSLSLSVCLCVCYTPVLYQNG